MKYLLSTLTYAVSPATIYKENYPRSSGVILVNLFLTQKVVSGFSNQRAYHTKIWGVGDKGTVQQPYEQSGCGPWLLGRGTHFSINRNNGVSQKLTNAPAKLKLALCVKRFEKFPLTKALSAGSPVD